MAGMANETDTTPPTFFDLKVESTAKDTVKEFQTRKLAFVFEVLLRMKTIEKDWWVVYSEKPKAKTTL